MRFSISCFMGLFVLTGLTGLIGCRFNTYQTEYRFHSGPSFAVQFVAHLDVSAGWGKAAYSSDAQVYFSGRFSGDTAKSEWALDVAADSLRFASSERAPEEDKYMMGRLRKYHARLAMTKSGQSLALDEEPALPQVQFTPTNFGRFLAYALPVFPQGRFAVGDTWAFTQVALDKFHPDAHWTKRFKLLEVRETAHGRIAVLSVDLSGDFHDDVGEMQTGSEATVTGTGRAEFDLAAGRPLSTELEWHGSFTPQAGADSSGPTGKSPLAPMVLSERVSLHFSY